MPVPLSEKPSKARFVVVAFTLALIAIAYVDRVCISTAAPKIRAELGLDEAQMGLVFGAFTLTYALFEVPGGWLADKFGVRKTLVGIVLFWSAMTALTGVAWGFSSLVAARLLFGLGEAGAVPSVARAYTRWLPEGARGRAFGAVIMTGAFAGAATQPLVVHLIPSIGWRATFATFGAVGVLWAAGWWAYFRDAPAEHRSVNATEIALIGRARVADSSSTIPLARLLRSRTLLALCVMYAGTIYGWYFYLTWLPTYLRDARGFDMKSMGWFSAAPLLGIGLGVFFGGILADALPRRIGMRAGKRLQGLIGLPSAALSIVAALNATDPVASALLLSAAATFAALGVSPAWTVCVNVDGVRTGVVSGTMNMFGNLGGALGSVVVGYCLRSLHSWNAPFFSIAGAYLVGAIAWLFVDPEQAISPDRDASLRAIVPAEGSTL